MNPHDWFQPITFLRSFSKVMAEKNELRAHSNDLSLIESNLWLGNLAAATNERLLEEKKVKYLLTINSFPLPKEIRNLSFIVNKYIEVLDMPEEDLLSHLEETYEFIEGGLKESVVLVHCCNGISRSAAVVVSYVMKKKQMTLAEALWYVKSKRESADPNPGFMEQLKLYESMKFILDKSNVQYKMFRLHVASCHVKRIKKVPECCTDVIQADPLLATENAGPAVYRCKKCRRVVARSLNEIPHSAKGANSWNETRPREPKERAGVCKLSYFIEPLAWMENVRVCLDGKLHCPNGSCRSKLGSFSWISGLQCPCGSKISPGFFLVPSKVDKENKAY